MTVTTHIDHARSRLRAERKAVARKREAFEAFAGRIAELPTEPAQSATPGVTATAGPHRHGESGATDRRHTVQRIFAETIRPHSVADADDAESLLATIRAEFTDTIAVALAPTTDASFSAELKEAIVAETRVRRVEAETLERALDRERTQLDDAASTVERITSWIADADETSLLDLGFDELRTRHETLATHRDRCQELADRRQAFLRGTTTGDSGARIGHRKLPPYLYEDFPVDHPVLSTVVRLDSACAECQRSVRNHLVRRV
jgi:hypothetical protein